MLLHPVLTTFKVPSFLSTAISSFQGQPCCFHMKYSHSIIYMGYQWLKPGIEQEAYSHNDWFSKSSLPMKYTLEPAFYFNHCSVHSCIFWPPDVTVTVYTVCLNLVLFIETFTKKMTQAQKYVSNEKFTIFAQSLWIFDKMAITWVDNIVGISEIVDFLLLT